MNRILAAISFLVVIIAAGADPFMEATIQDGTITVDWTMPITDDLAMFDDDGEGFVSLVYWEGSFTAATDETGS